jgi:hypothetical protein
MVLQSIGNKISFSNIKAEFNPTGTGLIKLSHYYANASTNYTNGITDIPNIGEPIKLSQFYGKSSLPIITINNVTSSWNSENSIIVYTFSDTTNNNVITFTKKTYCEILLVGGGSGTTDPDYDSYISDGGGSGGGIYYDPKFEFLPGTYKIIIGKAGTNHVRDRSYAYGGDTYITSNNVLYGTYKGIGGIPGPNDVASGGGPTYTYIATINADTSKTVNLYTYYGKNATYYLFNPATSFYHTFSGGGSGAGGSAALGEFDVNGGSGYISNITGSSVAYAGGGRGAAHRLNIYGAPGNGATNFGGGGSHYPDFLDPVKGCAIIKLLI